MQGVTCKECTDMQYYNNEHQMKAILYTRKIFTHLADKYHGCALNFELYIYAAINHHQIFKLTSLQKFMNVATT